MDEAAIEAAADEAMNELDEVVEDWTLKDALTYYEYMESNIQFRIAGLKADLAR